MDIVHSRMINNKVLNKDLDVVQKQAPPYILDRKLATCMAKMVRTLNTPNKPNTLPEE